MAVEINRERLSGSFIELCEISSPSKNEGAISSFLQQLFQALGADYIYEDESAKQTGSESGNLIIRFNGNQPEKEGLFFSCHMDTVEPGVGVEVERNNDIFTSKGETILGGDDKSGIAAIIEAIRLLKENSIDHPMIELIFTTCEEIGLLGAKNLDFQSVQTKFGYALDSSGIDSVIIGAPAANKIKIDIVGKAAHAGLCPEAGINALSLAAQALSATTLGRLDPESTCNFGIIHGGVATNIIPEQVTLLGEVRSHSASKLVDYTKRITDTFKSVINEWQGSDETGTNRPTVQIEIIDDYPALSIEADAPVVQHIKTAARLSGKSLQFTVAGGGSDANIFSGNNLPTAIVATGMAKVHTLDEQLDLKDLVSVTELVYSLIIA